MAVNTHGSISRQLKAVAKPVDFADLPGTVRLRDVTLRDGLQSIPAVLPLDTKLRLFRELIASGIADLQVTSFVNPARVPQLADAKELWTQISRTAGIDPSKAGKLAALLKETLKWLRPVE